MSDYFDEMNWDPVELDVIESHQQLLVARFLIENGVFGDDFDTHTLAPPASRKLVRELPERRHTTAADERCAICLKPNETTNDDEEDKADDADEQAEAPAKVLKAEEASSSDDADADDAFVFKVLPCKHAFHSRCILPWLAKTNSCPLCRMEMATDDEAYEERKKRRQRAAQREQELETLHDSMFG